MDKRLYTVGYRGNNGWKTKYYLGTRQQVDHQATRLIFDKIEISSYDNIPENINFVKGNGHKIIELK